MAPVFKVFDAGEVRQRNTLPFDGFRQGEIKWNEFFQNIVNVENVQIRHSELMLAGKQGLYACTLFTSQRLLLQFKESNGDLWSQVSIDYSLINAICVNSFFDGAFNVAIGVYESNQQRWFYWNFFRPQFQAATLWVYWAIGALCDTLSIRSVSEGLAWAKYINTNSALVIPDDFRSGMIRSGVDIAWMEDTIGLRLLDDQAPFIDLNVYEKFLSTELVTIATPSWNASGNYSSDVTLSLNNNGFSPDPTSLRTKTTHKSSLQSDSYSISDIWKYTKKSLDEVQRAMRTLGYNESPFDYTSANKICRFLVNSSLDDLLPCSNISSSDLIVKEESSTLDTTSSVVNQIDPDGLPRLSPSTAAVPVGLKGIPDGVDGLKLCLANTESAAQSFFNILPVVGLSGSEIYLNDDTMLVSPFDERLYCQIVKENHKYALAELYDQRADEAEKRGQKFKKWGTLGGIFLLNPLVPFMAYNQGKASAPRGSRLEELIPDPQLQFLQDRNSFLAMTQASGVLPRLRRMIFHKVDGPSGSYFRIIPAVITQDSVIPCQVFTFNSSCFLRPVSAGIEPGQENYDARRIHRQYYHPRTAGTSIDTGERILIKGKDIDDQRFKIFRFSSDTRDLSYFYVDYPADPSHVF